MKYMRDTICALSLFCQMNPVAIIHLMKDSKRNIMQGCLWPVVVYKQGVGRLAALAMCKFVVLCYICSLPY